jgi:hypothetical protein
MFTKALKIVWILCSLAVLVVTLAHYAPGQSSDIDIFFMYGMIYLAFPASLFVAGLFSLLVFIQEQSGVPLFDMDSLNYVYFSVIWLLFFVTGYAQWFMLLPWLWRKWKARRARSTASS